ncbi:hypothetical protein SY83_07025 [Paenibacillus swuensis]|uniref:Uncharacterized protein n=1 Tax=Paenibacillus swuensis TaxID=1178515 RepID=A0A172TGK9_9BACL|nr:glycoside hydrolase family 52 protein [Paenibacillus swuensis]ANE46076.1 hypothetical protein SY83_07025 [Paenibacillus swuensis]
MQLMGDCLSVLGSRLGMTWDPVNRQAYLIRHGKHPGIPLHIKAGVKLQERELVLPLTAEGNLFEFMDQDSSACSMKLSGIDAATGIRVKLTVTIPFRPRDAAFSTVPVIYTELAVDRMPSSFRWIAQTEDLVEGDAFLEIHGEGFSWNSRGRVAEVGYDSAIYRPYEEDDTRREIRYHEERFSCTDQVAILQGEWKGQGVAAPFSLSKGEKGSVLSLAWCVYDQPLLNVLGHNCPFEYTRRFENLEQVVEWAILNALEVQANAVRIHDILSNHTLGDSVTKLLIQTLHSWLMNTWWVVRENGQDWFTVWEGNCYFHSTVDVEYTQGPFYLTVWPELLEYELHQWPLFAKDGESCLGERGRDTVFLSHDMGVMGDSTKQFYPHEMEVEESANYILLAYTHWRRTGKSDVLNTHKAFIRKLMSFIVKCDTTGNGIPNKGCANTLDDASPAIQYGSEQVYLGVKSLAACQAGIKMLEYAGHGELEDFREFQQKALETIEDEGWLEDHYAATLTRTLDGTIDPWTGEPKSGELAGWDAHHIYTANGLALLDMVGHDTGLESSRLKSDLVSSTEKTLGRYGSRHTSYIEQEDTSVFVPGLASHSPKVGWISMNLIRDIAAAYRGIDLITLAENYWSWQCTTNTQETAMFFETFYGNNLSFYPRGVAVYGYMDAAAGFVCDAVEGKMLVNPLRGSMSIPLLLFADWHTGTAPKVTTELLDGRIIYELPPSINI